MTCFVIMPFAPEFEDVYAVIKMATESTISDLAGRCFRLDENRQAGRITDRLLTELRTATICIADITDMKPNVMWELGFAMALGKPTLIVTQHEGELPFDIHDMQSIKYKRDRLQTTLVSPLKKALLDTFSALPKSMDSTAEETSAVLGELRSQVSQLQDIVAELVAVKSNGLEQVVSMQSELQALAGHWYNTESGSNIYSRVIRGELVSPYCYGGNEELTGVYFGWSRTGEYWYARYQWIDRNISGFSFLRMESLEKMRGAWWYEEDELREDVPPLSGGGVPANWVKKAASAPTWAEDFFRAVEEEGLASLLARLRSFD